jgi:Flp pilus assembly protein TadD
MLPLGGALAAMGDSDSGSPPATPDDAAAAPASVAGGEAAAYFQQAKAAIRQERFDHAIAALQQVLKPRPDDADALNLMGYSQRRTGHLDRSLDYYNKALAQNPNHIGANEYLGELYLEMKDVKKAEERLAVLAKVCGASCEEYAELKEKIEKYKASSG